MATTITHASEHPLKISRGDVSRTVSFEPFVLPSSNQRALLHPLPTDTVIPLALRAVSQGSTEVDLNAGIEIIKSLQRQNILTKKLSEHGVLLLRGLPIHDAQDFSKVAHAFGYKPHELLGGIAHRPLLAPNVVPANELAKEEQIYSHSESTITPHSPSYVFFYAHRAPEKGGEGSVASCLELFQRAQQEMPEFMSELAERGMLYTVTYQLGKPATGYSALEEAFGRIDEGLDAKTMRAQVEAQIARYGRGKNTTWQWTDTSLILKHRLPALRTHPDTKFPAFFTGIAAYYKIVMANRASGKAFPRQQFGDGTPIPEKYLERLVEITEDIRVLHKWQQGDLLVYDNLLTQHGREPWEGKQEDRVVMASFFDADWVPGSYGSDEDWAQIRKPREH